MHNLYMVPIISLFCRRTLHEIKKYPLEKSHYCCRHSSRRGRTLRLDHKKRHEDIRGCGTAAPDTTPVGFPGGMEHPVYPHGHRLLSRRHAKRRGHETPHPVCCATYLQFFLVCLVLQPGMVSVCLFVAGGPVGTDSLHHAGLRKDFKTRGMADAALFAVGYVRGISEPWGVVAEPVTEKAVYFISIT